MSEEERPENEVAPEEIKTLFKLQSFRDLQVWKKAMELTIILYRLTQQFPREEAFCLTAQLRRCAISIASNIAEGHGRMNAREFNRFLLIARGSNCELQTQLDVSGRGTQSSDDSPTPLARGGENADGTVDQAERKSRLSVHLFTPSLSHSFTVHRS